MRWYSKYKTNKHQWPPLTHVMHTYKFLLFPKSHQTLFFPKIFRISYLIHSFMIYMFWFCIIAKIGCRQDWRVYNLFLRGDSQSQDIMVTMVILNGATLALGSRGRSSHCWADSIDVCVIDLPFKNTESIVPWSIEATQLGLRACQSRRHGLSPLRFVCLLRYLLFK